MHIRAGQRDGRRRQADDDFGGWAFCLLSVISRLSMSCFSPEILALKIAIELRSHRK